MMIPTLFPYLELISHFNHYENLIHIDLNGDDFIFEFNLQGINE